MAASPTRIRTQRDLHAMVALDTVDLLAERVRNLISHNRRITTARRYATYTQHPPEVLAGLTVDRITTWDRNGAGISVRLTPGVMAGFGFAAYEHENATEAGEWKRYHAGKDASDDFSARRRDMTRVTITGGLPGDGPTRDDKLIIQHYNRDGVCDEVVVAFDYNPDARERAARQLYVDDWGGDDDAHREVAARRWDCELADDRIRTDFLARADALLAVVNGKEG